MPLRVSMFLPNHTHREYYEYLLMRLNIIGILPRHLITQITPNGRIEYPHVFATLLYFSVFLRFLRNFPKG